MLSACRGFGELRGLYSRMHPKQRGHHFYLFAACDVETPDPIDVEDFLGLNLGVKNIPTDSDENNYSGGQLRRKTPVAGLLWRTCEASVSG